MYHPASHCIIRYIDDYIHYEPDFPPFVELDEPYFINPSPIVEVHAQWSVLVTEHFAGGGPPHIIDPYE